MKKIMFVCLGNICRSPMAEFVMGNLAEKHGLGSEFEIASAGTSSEEEGNPVYPPVRKLLNARGISCSEKHAVCLTRGDYEKYDYFIGMEESNRRNMLRIFGGDPEGKISLLMDYTGRPGPVADPWYTRDFKAAETDIDEGCAALLKYLTKK